MLDPAIAKQFQPAPENTPYRYVPVTCTVRDGQLIDIDTNEPLEIPLECRCDVGTICLFPRCQEQVADRLDDALVDYERDTGPEIGL